LKNIINKIRNNNAILYIFSRYISYVFQFINSLIIAVQLGPYYLGIWGIFSIALQYINLINFV